MWTPNVRGKGVAGRLNADTCGQSRGRGSKFGKILRASFMDGPQQEKVIQSDCGNPNTNFNPDIRPYHNSNPRYNIVISRCK